MTGSAADAGDPLGEDACLRHAGFLQRLARRLIQDEHDSEDLVQQAWTVALTVPPRAVHGPQSMRAWLARVVRNQAANLRRERTRRESRERSVARSEASLDEHDATPDVQAELCLQERVVAAVRALHEPYRTAIYLRYFRELEPRELAAHLGVPVATVHTRLLRGRTLLRAALTREFGGERRAWMAALLPLCPRSSFPHGGSPAGWLGVGVVGMKLKIALGIAAAAVAFAGWHWIGTGTNARPDAVLSASRPADARAPEAGATPLQVVERAGRSAAAVESPAAVEPEPAPAVPVVLSLAGHLLDLEGQPLPARSVRFTAEHDAPSAALTARTDARGAFVLEGLPGAGTVRTDEPDLATVIGGAFEGVASEAQTVVVAAPARPVSVVVVSESHAPLADARIELHLPPDLRTRFADGLERSFDVSYTGETDAEGRFQVARWPMVAGSLFSARLAGYEHLERPLEPAELAGRGTATFELVLASLARRTDVLAGRVVDAFGAGVPGAWVCYGRLDTRTEADGSFHFDFAKNAPFEHWSGDDAPVKELLAVHAGYLPARLAPPLDGAGEPDWPAQIVLRLGPPALSIAGRVVDQHGEPLAGMNVFLPQVHLLGGGTTVEGEMLGAKDFFLTVVTDAEGRFELGGLQELAYDVAAVARGTLLRGDLVQVPAGTRDVVIRVDTGAVWSTVTGRVVDGAGRAIDGVVVTPTMVSQTASGADGIWCSSEKLAPTTTDGDGRFVMQRIPRAHVALALEHPDIMHENGFDLPPPGRESERAHETLEDIVLQVVLRLRFQVVLDDPGEADALRILDGSGKELWAFTQTATSYVFRDANLLLSEGRSHHLFVEESAQTLILLRGGEEVRRIRLELAPRQENVVR